MADSKSATLKTVPLFAHCTGTQLVFIATQVEDMDFPAGKVLCREGQSGADFFGEIALIIAHSVMKALTLRVREAGTPKAD